MKTNKTIEVGRLHRGLVNEAMKVNDEDRTIELSFSSEAPYERFFGIEILGHDSENVRMGRLLNKGPLLVDHDPTDHVGVIEEAWIGTDRRGRARVRFGSGQRAAEVFQDVKDGIRNHVSVGYYVHSMEQMERGKKSEVETYRVTDWEPLEISFVSIAADDGVGVGRAADDHTTTVVIHGKENEVMEDTKKIDQAEIDLDNIKVKAADQAREAESRRQKDIRDAAAMLRGTVDGVDDLARNFLDNGQPIGAFLKAANEAQAKQPAVRASRDAEVGLTEKESKNFSILRAATAYLERDWRKAGFEKEASDAVAEKLGRPARGFYVPSEVLTRTAVSYGGTGDEVVATDHLAGSFIDLLRNRSYVTQAGARVLSGLVGNVDIPKLSSGATKYWIDNESTDTTESLPVFTTVSLTPKTVSAQVAATRRMLLQSSPAIEQILRSDLAATLATAIDYAALHGAGSSGEPRGLGDMASDGDINVVAIGATGGAPTFDHMVNLWREVAVDNADVSNMAYMTNPKVVAKLMKTAIESGDARRVMETKDSFMGYRVLATNQVSSTLSKSTSGAVLSAIFFGDWSQMLMGLWGGLDIKPDEVTLGGKGGLTLRAFQDVDINVRHYGAFAAVIDASTT